MGQVAPHLQARLSLEHLVLRALAAAVHIAGLHAGVGRVGVQWVV